MIHYLIAYEGSDSTDTVHQSEQDSVYILWIINDPRRVRHVYSCIVICMSITSPVVKK